MRKLRTTANEFQNPEFMTAEQQNHTGWNSKKLKDRAASEASYGYRRLPF